MKKTWILGAIEDLQQLATEHEMQSIAFALDNVMEIAEAELGFERAHDYTPHPKLSDQLCTQVLQFPEKLEPGVFITD